MQTNEKALSVKRTFSQSIFDELNYALAQTSSEDLKDWGKHSAHLFSRSAVRRGKNFFKLIKKGGKFALRETMDVAYAVSRHSLEDHLKDRFSVFKDTAKEKFSRTKQSMALLAKVLIEDPKRNAPVILTGFLGFMFGSGGLDGDGGVPDLDFAMGPGFHRSIWTHSVFSAIIIETVVYSFVELTRIIYEKLPEPHHPFWDKLMEQQTQYAQAFTSGASMGIAYHLLMDMNLLSSHIKPYADLPFSTTMEGHQAILGANAATEVADLKERKEKWKGL